MTVSELVLSHVITSNSDNEIVIAVIISMLQKTRLRLCRTKSLPKSTEPVIYECKI